jgi:hypothetical protein
MPTAKEQFAKLVEEIQQIEGFAHGDATAVAVRRHPQLYEAYRLEQVAKPHGSTRVAKATPLTYAERLRQRAPVVKAEVPPVEERRAAHYRGERTALEPSVHAQKVSAAEAWQAQVEVWKAHPDPSDPLSYDAYRWQFATAKRGGQG